MADIVKWLRPRIVVPIYVGSNPTIRPIKQTSTFCRGLFYYANMDFENPLQNIVLPVGENCRVHKAEGVCTKSIIIYNGANVPALLLAINVTSVFLFTNFICFKEKTYALCQ